MPLEHGGLGKSTGKELKKMIGRAIVIAAIIAVVVWANPYGVMDKLGGVVQISNGPLVLEPGQVVVGHNPDGSAIIGWNNTTATSSQSKESSNETHPASGSKESLSSSGEEIINPPVLEVADGNPVSDWRDPQKKGLKEQITVDGEVLTMKGDADAVRGAIELDSLLGSNMAFQAAFSKAKQDFLGGYILDSELIWGPAVLKYENEKGTIVCYLVKVEMLDYRLWKVTATGRGFPTSKESLIAAQYQAKTPDESKSTENKSETSKPVEIPKTSESSADGGLTGTGGSPASSGTPGGSSDPSGGLV